MKNIGKAVGLVAVFGAIIFAVCFLAHKNVKSFEKAVVGQTQRNLLTIAKTQAEHIESLLGNIHSQLEFLASIPTLKRKITENLEPNEIPETAYCPAKVAYEHLGELTGSFYRIDSKGIVQARLPFQKGIRGLDFSRMPGVKFVLENHKSHSGHEKKGNRPTSEIFTTNSGRKAISACEPVFENGEFIGILRVLVYLDMVNDMISSVKAGKRGYAWIIDHDGLMVAHPELQDIGRDIIRRRKEAIPEYGWFELQNIVTEMTNAQEDTGIYHLAWWEDGKLRLTKKLTAFAPIRMGSNLWSIAVSMDYDEVSGPVKAHSGRLGIIAGILILILVSISAVFLKLQKDKTKLEIKAQSAEELRLINKQLEAEITERSLAEEARRESEEKFRTLFNNAGDAILIRDSHGQFHEVNQMACDRLGYSRQELLRMTPMDLDTPEYAKKVPERTEQILKKGHIVFETVHVTKDGRLIPVEMNSCAIDYEGHPAIMSIARDITDRKLAEEEKNKLEAHLQHAEKMEAIGTLAGGIAHDLNNVLSSLVSYPELLLMELPEDSSLRSLVLTMEKSGKKAAAIVEDLLTLARRGVAVSEVSNLNDTVTDYLQSPEHEKLKSFHSGLQVATSLETDLLNVLGSPVHLSKTVMNLVSNAAEALPNGGKVIVSTGTQYINRPIRGYDEVKEGDYVVLSVADNGIGISAEDLERILEPFYTKKVMGRSGTGLGMTVVWGTVKDHKGYIDVESMEGKGTTFRLYFPVTRKEAQKDESATSVDEYVGNGETILVVDDIQEQREIASVLLNKLGYSVNVVSSGEEAVEYMKSNSADLIVLDMIMDPGIDGLDTYRRILELHPDTKAIIASGFSETDRVKEAQRLGAGPYVKKPYTLEKVGSAVRAELGD